MTQPLHRRGKRLRIFNVVCVLMLGRDVPRSAWRKLRGELTNGWSHCCHEKMIEGDNWFLSPFSCISFVNEHFLNFLLEETVSFSSFRPCSRSREAFLSGVSDPDHPYTKPTLIGLYTWVTAIHRWLPVNSKNEGEHCRDRRWVFGTLSGNSDCPYSDEAGPTCIPFPYAFTLQLIWYWLKLCKATLSTHAVDVNVLKIGRQHQPHALCLFVYFENFWPKVTLTPASILAWRHSRTVQLNFLKWRSFSLCFWQSNKDILSPLKQFPIVE